MDIFLTALLIFATAVLYTVLCVCMYAVTKAIEEWEE